MKMQVIYGRWDSKGRVSVDYVEERDDIDHYEAVRLSKLEGVACVAAQETMKARMVYVNGTMSQV